MGLVLALGSTVLISVSYLREHGAVEGLPALSLRRPLRSARLLLNSRAWLLGFAMESAGFGLYVVALALAPLALVQSVGAGGVVVLAVASARVAHRRLTHREVMGASLAVGGLVLLAVSLSGGDARDAQGSLGAIALWLAVTAGAAVLIFTSGRVFLERGVSDGIADGLFFAIGDICTKITTEGGGRILFVIPLIAWRPARSHPTPPPPGRRSRPRAAALHAGCGRRVLLAFAAQIEERIIDPDRHADQQDH